MNYIINKFKINTLALQIKNVKIFVFLLQLKKADKIKIRSLTPNKNEHITITSRKPSNVDIDPEEEYNLT